MNLLQDRRLHLVGLVLVVLGLSALPAALSSLPGTGTDDRAADAVTGLTDGGYTPWIEAPGIPGGEQNSPFFFGLQAFLGLAVLAGCLWYWRGRQSGA